MHAALPQRKTPEQLAQWLTENAVDKRTFSEEFPLNKESKHEYQEKIALATAAIYELSELKKQFSSTIDNGTEYIDDQRRPADFQIPPTKGVKELEENRKYYNKILKQGFETHDHEVFGIPYGADKTICFFNSEGRFFFDEPMSKEQAQQFAGLINLKV